MKIFNIKPVVNKKTGQINCSLPKKKLSDEDILNISQGKKIKLKFEGFEW